MINEVKNNWPLVPVHATDVTVLRKDPVSHLSLDHHKDSFAFENKARRTSAYFWEKGAFVDIYV